MFVNGYRYVSTRGMDLFYDRFRDQSLRIIIVDEWPLIQTERQLITLH